MPKSKQSTAEVKTEYVPLDELIIDPANPRRISEDELISLTRSIREFGFVQPVIARRDDRVVIGGNQRVLAARKLGLKTVPVVLVDLPIAKARALSLALNRISGTWDDELLGRLLQELSEAPDFELALTGFGEDELATLLRGLDARERRERIEQFDLDAALEATASPRTKPGDLWLLGEHRLLCGDSTDGGAIERLLAGERAAMAFTDPPYNVNYGNHSGQRRGNRRRRIANDALSPAEWDQFCKRWIAGLLQHVDGALYVCMSSKELPTVTRLLAEAGGHWSDTIIWAKDRFTLGRADYERQYEPIWYGWREGAHHYWCGDRNQGDVWEIARPGDSPLHPTMKPLELVERALENSSRPGDTVLDLFLGSGTTLIAAERTGRRCQAVELDPRYVDVAVARWEAFTGERATREVAR
jgi:DNA modification methylase